MSSGKSILETSCLEMVVGTASSVEVEKVIGIVPPMPTAVLFGKSRQKLFYREKKVLLFTFIDHLSSRKMHSIPTTCRRHTFTYYAHMSLGHIDLLRRHVVGKSR